MTRVLTEDFEGTLPGQFTTSSGTVAISTNQAFQGTHSLRANPASGTGYVEKNVFGGGGGEFAAYTRFYMRIATAPSVSCEIVKATDGATTQPTLRLETNRTLRMYNGGSATGVASSALALDTWYCVEFYYDDRNAGGDLGNNWTAFRLDGTLISSAANGNMFGWSLLRIGPQTSNTCDLYFDEVAINDTNGVSDLSWPGTITPPVNGRMQLEDGSGVILIEDGSGGIASEDYVLTMSPTGIASAEVVSGSGGGGGGVPTVDGYQQTIGSVGGTVTGTKPSGTGDFLIAFVSVDNDNAASATGWTVIESRNVGGTSADVHTTMLTAPASVASTTFTWATDATRMGTVVIYRISGSNSTINAVGGAGIGPTGNTTVTVNPLPQITTTVANCLLIGGIGGDNTATAGGSAFAWPAGWTEDTDIEDTSTFVFTGTAHKSWATASQTPAENVTATLSDHYGRIVVAIEPAPGGGGGPTVTFPPPTMQPVAIASAEAIGTHTATNAAPGSQTLSPTAISSQENFAGGGGVTPGLPGLVDGIEPEAQGSFCGPYMDGNGSLYRITEEYLGAPGPAPFGNHVMMLKSGDGGVTWTRMDAANGPGYGSTGAMNDLESAWLIQNVAAKQLYPIWCKAQGRWFSATYCTSDHPTTPDTWVTADNPVSGGIEQFGTTASESGIAGAITSTGVCHAFVRGTPQSSNEAFKWRKRASGTTTNAGWTDMGYITDAGINMTRPQAVVGESNKVYLFYRDGTNQAVRYRTITTADVVSAATTVSTSTCGTDTHYMNNCLPPVYYDDSGTAVVTVAYVNTSNVLRTVEVRGGAVGSEKVVSTDTLVEDPLNNVGAGTDNQGPSAALAVVGTTLYAFWGTGQLIKYATKANGAVSWSAATTYVDLGSGKEAQWIYANTFTRSGSTIIGLTYDKGPTADDDSDIYYNEFLAVGGGGTTVTQTAATFTMSPTAIVSAEAFGTTAVAAKISLAPLAIASVEAFGSATLSAKITLSPTAIASAEASGTTSVGAVVALSPSGVASAEAMGQPTLGAVITSSPTGIATAEAFGSATVTINVGILLSPTGITSAQTFGNATVSTVVTLSPTGVASGESFGTTVLAAKISLAAQGIGTAEAFGNPSLATVITVSPLGGVTGESFGQPSVSAVVTLSPTGLASAQAMGNPTSTTVVTLSPTGVSSTEAFGNANAGGTNALGPTGIASAQAFGVPAAQSVVAATAVGIGSSEAFGTTSLLAVIVMAPTGIASAQAFGVPSALVYLILAPTGISSAEAFGTATTVGASSTFATGIAGAEAFGNPSATLAQFTVAVGIASAQAVGNPTLVAGVTLSPIAVVSAEAVGSVSITTVVVLSPLGIASAESLGTPALLPKIAITCAGVVSAEAFGSPVLSVGYTAAPAGVASAEAWGTPNVTSKVTVQPAPVASAEAFGVPNLGNVNYLSPLGIASAQAMGTPSLASKTTMTPNGVASSEAFGLPSTLGKIGVSPLGIPSQQAVGNPVLQSVLSAMAQGIPSQEAWGAPVLVLGPPVIYTPATEAEAYFSNEDGHSGSLDPGDGSAVFSARRQDTSFLNDTSTTTMEA